MLKRAGFASLVLLSVLSFPGAGTSVADQRRLTEFDVHVGDTFMLSIGFPGIDIAEAANGDTIELIFTGRIDINNREADGTGAGGHLLRHCKWV